MGFYKVLSSPISAMAPNNYKGLYRSEPFPRSNKNKQLILLWERYVQYLEPLINMGITSELTIDELKDFANLATKDIGSDYEVVFFSESLECPYQAIFYGVDVTGLGGYSIIGDGLFYNSNNTEFFEMNLHFKEKLNSNGLFNTIEDAVSFRSVLYELETLSPGIIEQEDWHVINISKII